MHHADPQLKGSVTKQVVVHHKTFGANAAQPIFGDDGNGNITLQTLRADRAVLPLTFFITIIRIYFPDYSQFRSTQRKGLTEPREFPGVGNEKQQIAAYDFCTAIFQK